MTQDNLFSPRGKCVVLRLNRLKHLPPALYATQILHEKGVPLLVVEFGKVEEQEWSSDDNGLPTLRIQNRWTRFLKKGRPFAIFLGTLLQIIFLFLRKGRPALIVAHGNQEQCLTYLLTLLFGIDCVVHVHEIYELHEQDFWNGFFYRWGMHTLKRAKLLLYPEKGRAEIYRTKFGVATPYELVFNTPRRLDSVDKIDLRKRLGLPTDSLLMGYIGGIGKTQAFEQTFLALVEVPKVHFLIWGWAEKSYQEELLRLARKYRIEDRVHFLGVIEEEKWSLLASCDFAHCIYVPELLRLRFAATASNKLFEAMAVGIPVLTSNNPDFKEIVSALDIGATADPRSSTGIARAIATLASDSIARARWGQNGRSAHLSRYNYDAQFERPAARIAALFGTKKAAQPIRIIQKKSSPSDTPSVL